MNQEEILTAVRTGGATFQWVALAPGVEVMARPVRVEGRYVAVSARTAQLCADALCTGDWEVTLPTTKVEDEVWKQAEVKPEPHLISPARMNISCDAALSEASDKLADKLKGVAEQTLVCYGKAWVLDDGLSQHPGRAANYGLPSKSAPYRSISGEYKLWQTLGFAHNWQHVDYSQLLRLVRRTKGTELPSYGKSGPTRLNITEVHPVTTVRTLHAGLKGEDVLRWQHFLAGRGLLQADATGTFDEATRLATIEFQRSQGLSDDGWVGNHTMGRAMEIGYPVVGAESGDDAQSGPGWPPRPPNLSALGQQGRQALFGAFRFVPAPTPQDREAIKILDNWTQENIVSVSIPELVGIPGAPGTGKVAVHKKVAEPIQQLWKAWAEQGLLDRVLSYAGTWNPRFVRGSTTTLSAHAWGSAFDINVAWNLYGSQPALKGKKGSVRELVPTANELGWYWGGHFPARSDGMHFEWTG